MLIAFIGIFTVIFPAMWIYYLYKSEYIRSLYMKKREERLIPLLISFISFLLLTLILIFKLRMGPLIVVSFSSMSTLIFILLCISFFHKISLHTATLAGSLGILLAIRKYEPVGTDLLNAPVIFFTIALGLVMSARLSLQAHTKTEVYSGTAVGLAVCYGVTALLLHFIA
ncbi:hypothetical protein GCM10023331_08400 [Algivirga pacifica]|uniref:PAP2 superfamily protein n=2 Tax=Algivirga pacifica TaxID=1162670 RepID=A0ABP9D4U0_9BACT